MRELSIRELDKVSGGDENLENLMVAIGMTAAGYYGESATYGALATYFNSGSAIITAETVVGTWGGAAGFVTGAISYFGTSWWVENTSSGQWTVSKVTDFMCWVTGNC